MEESTNKRRRWKIEDERYRIENIRWKVEDEDRRWKIEDRR